MFSKLWLSAPSRMVPDRRWRDGRQLEIALVELLVLLGQRQHEGGIDDGLALEPVIAANAELHFITVKEVHVL